MYHRPARVIVAILAVTLVAVNFGAAADHRGASADGLAPSTTVLAMEAERDAWCANLANAPALRDAAATDGEIGPSDGRWMTVLEVAADRPETAYAARDVGSQYAALADRWDDWDRVCRDAYVDTT